MPEYIARQPDTGCVAWIGGVTLVQDSNEKEQMEQQESRNVQFGKVEDTGNPKVRAYSR